MYDDEWYIMNENAYYDDASSCVVMHDASYDDAVIMHEASFILIHDASSCIMLYDT